MKILRYLPRESTGIEYALIPPAETWRFVVFFLHGNLRPGYKTSLVFFSALNFYLFLVEISMLYNFIYVNFSKLKCQYKLMFQYCFL